jgi:hypothetical protein
VFSRVSRLPFERRGDTASDSERTETTLTSREHARRLMLILLSSQGGPESTAGPSGGETGERDDDRQAGDGRDDSPEADERRTTALVEALMLT